MQFRFYEIKSKEIYHWLLPTQLWNRLEPQFSLFLQEFFFLLLLLFIYPGLSINYFKKPKLFKILDLLRFFFIKSELHYGRFAPFHNSLILCYKISVNLILVTSNLSASVRLEPSLLSPVQIATYYMIITSSGKMVQGSVLVYYNTFTKLFHQTMSQYLKYLRWELQIVLTTSSYRAWRMPFKYTSVNSC